MKAIALLILGMALTTAGPGHAETRPLPPLRVMNAEGGIEDLKQIVGQGPCLLLFWNTPCRSCLDKLHEIERFALAQEEAGLSFLMINIDPPRNLKQVKPFVHRHDFTAPIYYDSNREAFVKLGGRHAPFVVLLNAESEQVFSSITYRSQDLETIAGLLAGMGLAGVPPRDVESDDVPPPDAQAQDDRAPNGQEDAAARAEPSREAP